MRGVSPVTHPAPDLGPQTKGCGLAVAQQPRRRPPAAGQLRPPVAEVTHCWETWLRRVRILGTSGSQAPRPSQCDPPSPYSHILFPKFSSSSLPVVGTAPRLCAGPCRFSQESPDLPTTSQRPQHPPDVPKPTHILGLKENLRKRRRISGLSFPAEVKLLPHLSGSLSPLPSLSIPLPQPSSPSIPKKSPVPQSPRTPRTPGLHLLPDKLKSAGLGYSGFSMTPGPNLSSRKRR